MTRSSRKAWLRPLNADQMELASWVLGERGFWAYVDSSEGPYRTVSCKCDKHKPGPMKNQSIPCPIWAHRRGDDDCLASNSGGEQCGMEVLPGVPFCSFHFDRAWEAFAHFVEGDIAEMFRRKIDSEYRNELSYFGIEVAEVRDARRVLDMQPERVYFFAAGHAVKIGRSTDPEKRVRSLKGTLAPDDVDTLSGQLLGTIPGGPHAERALHQRFHQHRLVGEWFALEPIRHEIETLIAMRAEAGAA